MTSQPAEHPTIAERMSAFDAQTDRVWPHTEAFLAFAESATELCRARKLNHRAQEMIERDVKDAAEKMRALKTITAEDLKRYSASIEYAKTKADAFEAALKSREAKQGLRREAMNETPVPLRAFVASMVARLVEHLGEPDPYEVWETWSESVRREPKWDWSRFTRYTAEGTRWRRAIGVALHVDERGVYLCADRASGGGEAFGATTPHVFIAFGERVRNLSLDDDLPWPVVRDASVVTDHRGHLSVLASVDVALAAVLHLAQVAEGETLEVDRKER